MKNNSVFIHFYAAFFYIISCGFSESASITSVEAIESKLQQTRHCTQSEAHAFLHALNSDDLGENKLTQDDIAEALRLSQSTVSKFLSKTSADFEKKTREIVCEKLWWYYSSVPIPLSSLKEKWNKSRRLSTDTNTEDCFLDSKKYVLLPKELKDRDRIKQYLSDLIDDEDENIDVLSRALLISKETISSFVERRENFKSVYLALRNYYRCDGVRRLSALIAREKIERERLTAAQSLEHLASKFMGLGVSKTYTKIKAK